MISQLQREALLDVIERCAWLIEYYGRTDAAPQSLDALKATMQQAVNDLEALAASIKPNLTDRASELATATASQLISSSPREFFFATLKPISKLSA